MRQLLVIADKTFKLTIPDDAKVTFGPWSPPTAGVAKYDRPPGERAGTLRVYGRTKEDVLGVFSGVVSFRDLSLGYSEVVAREEGATIWKDDEKGYVRDSKVQRKYEWVEPDVPALADKTDDGEF